MDRLSEIRARCEAATPGPWKAVEHGNTVKSHAIVAINRDVSIVPIAAGISPKTGNAAFISHARDDIPYLLAEVERLNQQLNSAKIGWDTYKQYSAELTARAEKAKAERDAIKDDFQDFATSGIYNMNPYCSNRCADCTDGRGWCIESHCKGFCVAAEPPKEGE